MNAKTVVQQQKCGLPTVPLFSRAFLDPDISRVSLSFYHAQSNLHGNNPSNKKPPKAICLHSRHEGHDRPYLQQLAQSIFRV
jgi:hypothetical protein